MSTFLDNLKTSMNYTLTENGAITHKSTLNGLMDLFALGGAYRSRSDEDCITLFQSAYAEDPSYALKCLFYLRDVRGGQGERRFFRVVCRWLAENETEAMKRNLIHVPEFGRWDDLYTFVDTPLEKAAFDIMYHQLALDIQCKTPSLLAKWLKSENTSSKESQILGARTREAFKMTSRQYRKTLSTLRARIRVLERLMSEGRWDEIEFDKIPSRAGIIYRNAFARNDMTKERYAAFAKSKETKVNAAALYPHDVAHRAFDNRVINNPTEREMLQKYWDNLPNYYGDNKENGIAVVDVSGSMSGVPMEAAISMGAYIADKAHGPFAGHFITFSNVPSLVGFRGPDIVSKFRNCREANWGMNTNLAAVFQLLLNTALENNVATTDMPERIYIFSDMEFDSCLTLDINNRADSHWNFQRPGVGAERINTFMEQVAQQWAAYGYKLPSVVFWNLNARNNNIPAIGPGFSYVSGFSPVMIEQILSGKDGLALVLEKLNTKRYEVIK